MDLVRKMTLTASSSSVSNFMTQPNVAGIGLMIVLLYCAFSFQSAPSRSQASRSLPFINGRKRFEFRDANAKERYRASGRELLELGLKRVSHVV